MSVQVSKEWRILAKSPLRWRCWDGDYVVYDPLSGHTHKLDLVTGTVLESIAGGSHCTEDICALVADFLEVGDAARVVSNVGTILNRLEEIGLVESSKS